MMWEKQSVLTTAISLERILKLNLKKSSKSVHLIFPFPRRFEGSVDKAVPFLLKPSAVGHDYSLSHFGKQPDICRIKECCYPL